ncbi:MAG TPA: class I SAM-dependent methyltransferase [Pyrinomonadaceae bacterium]|nr:class I SAM-dependent methyltransferase [Pyrinomonadaceae bacterium]
MLDKPQTKEVEEVYLWRGSTEQRALRSMWGKAGRFTYFNEQLGFPVWRGKKVLDFGGNEGNLLMDNNCTIDPENYYCIDVLEEALAEGRKRFPQAHWIHYNRYNCSFNPEGIRGLPIPDAGINFQMILAYSVFTHTTRDEMHSLVNELQAYLAPGGTLAFTFIDPHFHPWPETYPGNNLNWRLEKSHKTNPSVDVNDLLARSRDADWCALVGGSMLHINRNGSWRDEARQCLTYNVFYTIDFLQKEFPNATIRPPVNGEMQHCCLIRTVRHPRRFADD